jgi:hypothetical protein
LGGTPIFNYSWGPHPRELKIFGESLRETFYKKVLSRSPPGALQVKNGFGKSVNG